MRVFAQTVTYVVDGCINGGQLAYFSSFTMVRGVTEHFKESIRTPGSPKNGIYNIPKGVCITPYYLQCIDLFHGKFQMP